MPPIPLAQPSPPTPLTPQKTHTKKKYNNKNHNVLRDPSDNEQKAYSHK